MSKMKQNFSLQKLKKAAKFEKQENKEIIDIILFGSSMRGKINPKDIDILVLSSQKLDKPILKEFNPIYKTYSDFVKGFPTESIIQEGYSLLHGKTISSLYHLHSTYLFRYSLKGKTKSERMRFYYALYGRNTKGILKETNSKKFSSETIITPVQAVDEMKSFFETNKIEYYYVPIMFPESYKDAEKLSAK
ncbi:MAG: nucleotidyltransferase domain-containing protein [Candidatus Woesearchaeota archaeon]|jgi:predicted nucleotidyltransferase|nr:nucleotidyltransferase domain-containing protein [Candidatus Woesearchaeota archaeon]